MRHDIFPTPVWHIEGAPLELVDELYEKGLELKQFHKVEDKGFVYRSNQGGYQTTQINWKDFHPEGIEYINKIVSESIETPKGREWNVLGWWYNINPKDSWNAAHNHSGTDLALVWYLTDSYSTLNLMNPNNRIECIDKSLVATIHAKKGDIIFFPGDIIHYVMPNPKETDRVCIAMNLQLL